jgi:hypothetical protein
MTGGITLMELVFKEANGLAWYYESGSYSRKKGDSVIAKISGTDIPDPYHLWQRKCSAAGQEFKQAGYAEYRPQEVIFKLWDHWNNVNNNN